MSKEDLSITYENNIFYCTKNNTKWISVDGEKWYGEEKHIAELEKENAELKEKLKPENCLKLLAKEGYIKFSSDQLTYAKTIIKDLLDNTDEYARQRAEDFLEGKE